tara:strand:+ start:1877 stop:2107 length:231 start_codon:yes stop_codon:yes gene_type:complete
MDFSSLTVYMAVYDMEGISFEETKTANLKQGDFVTVSNNSEGMLYGFFMDGNKKMVVLKNNERYSISDATDGVVIF